MDIMTFLICLDKCLSKTLLRQLTCIIEAMLSMTGRVTMLGISRWTEKGGSYRTIQRFFNTSISWCKLNWFVIHHMISGQSDIIMAGDETTVTKSGKKTYGVDRFFSSIFNRPVPGIAFFCLSLINVKNQTSYPIIMEQIEKEKKKDKKDSQKTKKKPKKKKSLAGRPKGSRNKNKKEVELSPYLLWVQGLIRNLLGLIGANIPIIYFVFDGAFGHNDALQMVRQCGLHLISKLRYDSALWFPYIGPYSGRGTHKKYGKKLDYDNMPDEHLVQSVLENHIQTNIYQMNLWHKEFPEQLNIVVIVKKNLKTSKSSHIVLFCSNLKLAWDKIIAYYRSRFQIEFNFRDAKQHWGLEDFMNVNAKPVYNGANLSMFMVNFSQILIQNQSIGLGSINDLKSWFRGRKYVQKILKLLPQKPEPIFIKQIHDELSALGRIHAIAGVI